MSQVTGRRCSAPNVTGQVAPARSSHLPDRVRTVCPTPCGTVPGHAVISGLTSASTLALEGPDPRARRAADQAEFDASHTACFEAWSRLWACGSRSHV
jgi:hypothetical protein